MNKLRTCRKKTILKTRAGWAAGAPDRPGNGPKALAAAGVLREQTVGKEKLFVHPKLMILLTRDSNAFEAYCRRAA